MLNQHNEGKEMAVRENDQLINDNENSSLGTEVTTTSRSLSDYVKWWRQGRHSGPIGLLTTISLLAYIFAGDVSVLDFSFLAMVGAYSQGEAPETAARAIKLKLKGNPYRNGQAETAGNSPRDGTTLPPFILPYDFGGQVSQDIGLSPAWQAQAKVLEAGVPEGTEGEWRWRLFTQQPGYIPEVLNRMNGQSPFSDCSRARSGLYRHHAGNAVATQFAPESTLQAQYDFCWELSLEIGRHVAFLTHCLDVGAIYEEQRQMGATGHTSDHRSETYKTWTPYERYHDLLLEQFNPVDLGIKPGQQLHYTMIDLASRALELLFPAHRGSVDSGAWVLSPGTTIIKDAFEIGYSTLSYGMTNDGDGNPRMVVGLSRYQAKQGFDAAVHFGTTGHDLAANRGRSWTVTPKYGAAGEINGLPVPPAYAAAFGTVTDTCYPVPPAYVAPMVRDDNVSDYAFQRTQWDLPATPALNGAATTFSETKQLWTLPTPEIVHWLNWASEQYSPDFEVLEFDRLQGYTHASVQESTINWSDLIDLENTYSRFKMQFNPKHNIDSNNGPFWQNNIDAWTPMGRNPMSSEEKATWAELAVRSTTVATGIGVDSVPLARLLGLLEDKPFDTLVTGSASMVAKQERSVVLPADRTDANEVFTSGIDISGIDSLVDFISSALDYGHRHDTLAPATDVDMAVGRIAGMARYEGTVGLCQLGLDTGGARLERATYGNNYGTASYNVAPGLDTVAMDKSLFGEGNLLGLMNTGNIFVDDKATMELIRATTFCNVDTTLPISTGSFAGVLVNDMRVNYVDVHNSQGKQTMKGGTFTFLDKKGNPTPSKAVLTADTLATLQVTAGSISSDNLDVIGTVERIAVNRKGGVSWALASDFDAKAIPHLEAGKTIDDLKLALDALTIPKNSSTYVYKLTVTQADTAWWDIPTATLVTSAVGDTFMWVGITDFTTTELKIKGAPAIVEGVCAVTGTFNGSDPIDVAEPMTDLVFKHMAKTLKAIGVNVNAPVVGDDLALRALVFSTGVDHDTASNMNLIIPETVNYVWSPRRELFDAEVCERSGMRFYLRDRNTISTFVGLPYHGEPGPFLRAFVPSGLLKHDRLVTNPFQTAMPGKLRVTTVRYEPNEMQAASEMARVSLGTEYIGNITMENLIQAQDLILRRKMI